MSLVGLPSICNAAAQLIKPQHNLSKTLVRFQILMSGAYVVKIKHAVHVRPDLSLEEERNDIELELMSYFCFFFKRSCPQNCADDRKPLRQHKTKIDL